MPLKKAQSSRPRNQVKVVTKDFQSRVLKLQYLICVILSKTVQDTQKAIIAVTLTLQAILGANTECAKQLRCHQDILLVIAMHYIFVFKYLRTTNNVGISVFLRTDRFEN